VYKQRAVTLGYYIISLVSVKRQENFAGKAATANIGDRVAMWMMRSAALQGCLILVLK